MHADTKRSVSRFRKVAMQVCNMYKPVITNRSLLCNAHASTARLAKVIHVKQAYVRSCDGPCRKVPADVRADMSRKHSAVFRLVTPLVQDWKVSRAANGVAVAVVVAVGRVGLYPPRIDLLCKLIIN